jgi:HEAT repeat protein
MTVSLQDVRAYLDAEEVDYPAASLLGAGALPHLQHLVRGDDPMLAAKATYLASLIAGPEQGEILSEAAASDITTVRVAAASALGNLDEPVALDLVDRLIDDSDAGVCRQAVIAAANFGSEAMLERVARASREARLAFPLQGTSEQTPVEYPEEASQEDAEDPIA